MIIHKKKINIAPTCEQIITVKTNYADGQYIQDEFNWSKDLQSPSALVTVTNNTFRTTVRNYSDSKKIIFNNTPLPLESFVQQCKTGRNPIQCKLNSVQSGEFEQN